MEISQKKLGDIVKFAREKSGITIEALSERLDITERYLYRIENEGKIPSFKLLYKIIRELSIDPDSIFYPEKPTKDSEVENLLRMLSACDEYRLIIIKSVAKMGKDDYVSVKDKKAEKEASGNDQKQDAR